MNESNKILDAIESLRTDMTGRLDSIETRLTKQSNRQHVMGNQLKYQQAQIDELFRQVKLLTKPESQSVIWRSSDGHRAAIDRKKAYDTFDKLGIDRSDALRLMDEAKMLNREASYNGRTKNVRLPDTQELVKAVVIFLDKIDVARSLAAETVKQHREK